MPPQTHTIKINLAGGIVSAGDLLTILEAAEQAGVGYVQFGHRQQLLLLVVAARLVQTLAQAGIPCEVDADRYPNISSSYVVEDVFHNTAWLREGAYKDILDLFGFQPPVPQLPHGARRGI